MSSLTDPVCGMAVDQSQGRVLFLDGQQFHFCSDYCRRAFEADPARYIGREHPRSGRP